MWCSAVQCGAVWVQHGAVRYSVVQCGALWCSVVQCGAACCMLHIDASQLSNSHKHEHMCRASRTADTMSYELRYKRVTMSLESELRCECHSSRVRMRLLLAVCCSVLQWDIVCCSEIQCVACVNASLISVSHMFAFCSVLQCAAACCSVLQCVARVDVPPLRFVCVCFSWLVAVQCSA